MNSSRTMSKKQLNIHVRVFFPTVCVLTLSLNKLHRITLTENSHLNKILISRALVIFVCCPMDDWLSARQGLFLGAVDTESRMKCRRKACRKAFWVFA